MSENKLHPSVQSFRTFINNHPKLRSEIRKNGRSWQEYYEKWALLGEEDSYWEKYRGESETEQKSENKADMLKQLMKYTENVDIDKVQKQVHQLSGAITTIQELIDQYQGTRKGTSSRNQPFNWSRD
ncbi:YlbD family protein [Ornithinibacillus contaminans]|uniref:YlbD family protein n=1 Tax=Ornithinibacillus contaminans TaxID=694055 RepID=UPI00064E1314|nr:spore coat protein YlbD [Ornithinibacillus contaminans]